MTKPALGHYLERLGGDITTPLAEAVRLRAIEAYKRKRDQRTAPVGADLTDLLDRMRQRGQAEPLPPQERADLW